MLFQAALIGGLLYERRRRLLAEIQSRQRMSELTHVNRFSMAGELTASIAHELHQPLGAILINTDSMELILKSPSPDMEELREIVSEIRRDDERAGKVIQNIRSLLRKAPVEFKELDLNNVVRETLDFLSSLAVARKVHLRDAISSLPLLVNGDPIQLQQVLLNLIVNALDATADKSNPEKTVTVRTTSSDDWAHFSVSDTGTGIPAVMLPQIFEPFFSTKPSGMGMGLSIARTIVENHGGTLWAQNELEGATFSVKLPLIR